MWTHSALSIWMKATEIFKGRHGWCRMRNSPSWTRRRMPGNKLFPLHLAWIGDDVPKRRPDRITVRASARRQWAWLGQGWLRRRRRAGCGLETMTPRAQQSREHATNDYVATTGLIWRIREEAASRRDQRVLASWWCVSFFLLRDHSSAMVCVFKRIWSSARGAEPRRPRGVRCGIWSLASNIKHQALD
jgi:hypothetical protein